jgi:uncharacterized membrane protein (UPF0127 family)
MRIIDPRAAGWPAALILGLAMGLHLFCMGRGGEPRFVKVFFPNGASVTAELAVTEEERARGLMFREKIMPDQGMLFVFEDMGLHSFWMKNTLIPLDMLWLDNDKRIVHIESGVPPCQEDPCPSYGPRVPARYVLELKSGRAEELGLKPYDRLQFVLPESVLKILR